MGLIVLAGWGSVNHMSVVQTDLSNQTKASKPDGAISVRHAERTEEAKRTRRQFANAFAYLVRERQRNGAATRGCQLLAAKAAGIGEGSHCNFARYKAQKTMSTRMMKEPSVVAELQRLGLEWDAAKGGWHDPKLGHTR